MKRRTIGMVLLGIAAAVLLLMVLSFGGCGEQGTAFTPSDFIENAMHQPAETVFDRYGWDLDAAEVVSEEDSETVYQTAETIAVGEYEVSPELTFIDGECTAVFYRVDFPADISHEALYDFLMEQSDMAREEIRPYCDPDSENFSYYDIFPDDSYPTLEEFEGWFADTPGGVAIWSWPLFSVDESGSTVSSASLAQFAPEHQGADYPSYTFYVNEMQMRRPIGG